MAATASSGLAVSYASNSAAVCTVAGGTAVLVAPGLCSITASQPGGPGIAAATPVTQTFNVTLNPNAITFPKPADLLLTAGPAALAATASSGLAVAYASNAPAVCTVSGATAVLVAAGTCSITATQPGNASFAAATPVTQTFAVRPVAAAPVALSFSVDVPYLSPGQAIDLAPHVTGSFTSLALASASASGTVALAASVATYKPGRGFSGGDRFTYTATGPGGTSAPATVTITVGNRPDPSLDPDVKGIVNAEVAAMTRFGSAQDDNINRRLETIHDDNVDAVSIGTGIAVNEALPAGAQALTEIKHNDPALAGAKSALALKSAFPEKPAARGVKYVESPFYFWTGGSILFGRTSVNGTTDNRFATSGVTAGVDAKFIDGFKAGLAAGFANDRTRVGVNGSRTSATFYSASAYASYRLLPKTFLDATLGYGTATFDTRRFITQEQVFATGKRNGHEVFGSLTLTREETWEGVKIATYGRLYAAQVTLDRSTEAGSNIFALAYGKLSQTSFAGTLGLRALYPIAMDWGKLTPMARLEYRHAFDNAYKQGLVYADQPAGQSYTVSGLGSTRDLFSGALGLQAEVGGNVKANLEYQLYLSAQKVQAQGLRGIVVIGF